MKIQAIHAALSNILHITILVLSFFFISCSRTPNTESIRLYARASEAYSLGRFADVKEILLAQKNFSPALLLRAKAEYFSGDIEKAEKSCRRALKLRPSSLEANLYLARILREKNDLTGAADTAEKMLADNPQDIRALRLAAEIAMEIGKFDEALIFLDRAAEYSAESAMVLLDRARLRWVSGRAKDALEDLSRAKAMLPWDTPLLRSITNLENIIREVQ
ncbi:MAG: tetratricopeptide repeat protein [Treponema sp.]|nr:tetratricopeptide repeat protein [Treponema sp.]MCL2250621.1 tetratricopeptide repeat protein [Treponema sp.]